MTDGRGGVFNYARNTDIRGAGFRRERDQNAEPTARLLAQLVGTGKIETTLPKAKN